MSGIAILRKLLMKQAVKKSAQASGIMSIGSDVRKLVEKKTWFIHRFCTETRCRS